MRFESKEHYKCGLLWLIVSQTVSNPILAVIGCLALGIHCTLALLGSFKEEDKE